MTVVLRNLAKAGMWDTQRPVGNDNAGDMLGATRAENFGFVPGEVVSVAIDDAIHLVRQASWDRVA